MKFKAYVCALALLCAVAGAILRNSPPATSPDSRIAIPTSQKSKQESRNAKLVNGKAKPAGLRPSQADPGARARLVNNYGRLPLRFEANSGQTDARVKFLSRGRGYTMFLTGDEAVLSLRSQKPEIRSQNRNWKRETGNWKFETGKSKLENRRRGFRDLESGIFNLPSLLPRPGSLVQNPKSEIQNLPAPGVVRMKLEGANPKAKVSGMSELPGKSNYFIGNDPKKWRTNVSNYAEVKYEGVYPGIDLVYYGSEGGQLEYDFVVAPGADPSVIAFDIVGAGLVPAPGRPRGAPLRIDSAGDLVIPTDAGEVRFHKPVVYQGPSTVGSWRSAVSGEQLTTHNQQPTTNVFNPESKISNPKLVDGRFVLLAENRVGFDIPNYDKSLPLVIDPVLIYSTYFGGSGDDAVAGIAVDASGSAYVTGSTTSVDFPVTDGSVHPSPGAQVTFVSKLNPEGSGLVFSTFLGVAGQNIALGPTGNVYISSWGILTVLSADGSSLVSSTLLEFAEKMAVDSLGQVYVAGQGNSALRVQKLDITNSTVSYQLDFGDSRYRVGGIAVDSAGSAYVTGAIIYDFEFGADAFVAKVNAEGTGLVYEYVFGGSSRESVQAIAVDADGNAYITGGSASFDFPTTPGAFQTTRTYNNVCGFTYNCPDVIVVKVDPTGSSLVYATFLDGDENGLGNGIAVDSAGHAYVVGNTGAHAFSTVLPFQPAYGGGDHPFNDSEEGFVARLSADASSLDYSSYYGGPSIDTILSMALHPSGDLYVGGKTDSSYFYPEGVPTDIPIVNAFQPARGGRGLRRFYSQDQPGPRPRRRAERAYPGFRGTSYWLVVQPEGGYIAKCGQRAAVRHRRPGER